MSEKADERTTFVLVGRPNAGKSTLYNVLTGGAARVGNFPGITVDVLEGQLDLSPNEPLATCCDLPGIYNLQKDALPDTDEGAARTFLERIRTQPKRAVLVWVIDATQLAVTLPLAHELCALQLPMVVVLTQIDLLGSQLPRTEMLADHLGCPVIAVSARDSRARDTLRSALTQARRPKPIAEGDDKALARAILPPEATLALRNATSQFDRVLLHPILGPVVFLAVMTAIFSAVFFVSDPVTNAMDAAVAWSGLKVIGLLGNHWWSSLIHEGLLGGAGTVLAFLPQIVILSLALDLLDASGYLARGAFIVDRVLHAFGLSGRSFLPLLMGHACAIPALSATRILRDRKERLAAIAVIPLMTCSARLPTYALILGTFFGDKSPLVRGAMFVCLYGMGVVAGMFASWVITRLLHARRSLPLLLEMPAYRSPEPQVVLRNAVRTAHTFLRDVGTTIVIASTVLWILLKVHVPAGLQDTRPLVERSLAAHVGRAAEPITRAAGFDWRINVGLVGSFGARELMVGTLGVIAGVENADREPQRLGKTLRELKKLDGTPAYNRATALALLVFFVIACQCMSTVAAIRRETRSFRWPAFVLGYTYALAYVASVVTYQLAKLFHFT